MHTIYLHFTRANYTKTPKVWPIALKYPNFKTNTQSLPDVAPKNPKFIILHLNTQKNCTLTPNAMRIWQYRLENPHATLKMLFLKHFNPYFLLNLLLNLSKSYLMIELRYFYKVWDITVAYWIPYNNSLLITPFVSIKEIICWTLNASLNLFISNNHILNLIVNFYTIIKIYSCFFSQLYQKLYIYIYIFTVKDTVNNHLYLYIFQMLHDNNP